MVKKEKSQKCEKGRCKNHLYVLKPLKKNLYFTKAQRAKFCPNYNKQTRQFEDCLPIINSDHKQYTPLFVLPDQKILYHQNNQKMQLNHQKRIKECASKDELFVPRHARKRQFCSVCKQTYNEYIEHIAEEGHKLNIRKNKYNQYIVDLSQLFQKKSQNKKIEIQQVEDSTNDIDKYIQKVSSIC